MSVLTYVIADDSRSFCRMRRFIQARAVTQKIQARFLAQKILMQDTGNKCEGERSVFTYVTDPESRSFRSVAQKIQASLLAQ